MFKKILALVLALVMTFALCLSFTACGETKTDDNGNTEKKDDNGSKTEEKSDLSEIKLGVILLHDENSTYDLNFINGVNEAKKTLGLSDDQVIFMRNIAETGECSEAARDLVDEGCNIIFADSFGHESNLITVAKEFPDVQFCHATGNQAHTSGLSNMHNAFANIYEGRYLAGIAAGLKLNEIKAAGNLKGDVPMMGYVGAFTYAEVISGYTSFYLGAKAVCPDVQMKVQFTGSWYDEKEEKSAAEALIAAGCDLISQHADSMGAPTACEDAGIPNVSYNGSTETSCPNTFVVSSRINWAPYFEYICKQVAAGKAIDTDWVGTIATGSVLLTDIGAKAPAAETNTAIEAAKKLIEAGTLHIFDISAFTVTVDAANFKNANAKVDETGHLTSYMADVNFDEAYTGDTEVVKDGYFHESEYRSAPYFDLQIDGIELLNAKF